MGRSLETRTYLVECFAGAADDEAVAGARDRLRSACADLRSSDTVIDYLGALLLPQDELVLHVFAASDADVVREVSRRGALRVERVVESVAIGPSPDGALVVPARRSGATARERPTRRA